MLTSKQKEIAARELCRLRGVDPDKQIAHEADPSPEGYVPGVCLYSPAWTRALCEINAQEQLAAALEAGRNHGA